jgi:Tfp pilus assembly protein PilE
MGQQQLLLIVLSVIIVGIAVVVGINVFTASAASSNRDSLISSLTNLGSLAQLYYRKPTALAGGGNSFVNWTIPTSLQQTANMSAAVTPTVIAAQVTLVAVGTETGNDGTTKTKVTLTVTSTGITTAINN